MKAHALENGFDIYASKPGKEEKEDSIAQQIDRSILLYMEEKTVVMLSGIRKKRLQLFLNRHKEDFPVRILPNGKRLICLKFAFAYIGNVLKEMEEKKIKNPQDE